MTQTDIPADIAADIPADIPMRQETASFGYQDIDAREKEGRVGALFSGVAASYDLMNDAMSGGLHRVWKDQFVARVKPKAGEDILDMAGGTGDIAFRMVHSGAHITVADINQEMLDVGLDRALKRGEDRLVWSRQNAENLAFPDRSFDAYTIAFGIRNVTHIDVALKEAYRALRYGGRFFCLEFSASQWSGFAEVYDFYSHRIMPKIGKLIANDEDSYRYLVESIRRFPSMPAFADMIRDAGFAQVKYEPIMGGAVAIHSGWKI